MYLKCMLIAVVVIEISVAQNVSYGFYLGPQPSKKFFFPWVITFHRETSSSREFIGSGTLVSKKWVFGSMDCFIRKSKFSPQMAFYQDVGNLQAIAGGIYVELLPRRDKELPKWLDVQRVDEIYMLSSTASKTAITLKFTSTDIPQELNNLERSPFGFSMAIALVKVKKNNEASRLGFEYRRGVLPLPLNFGQGTASDVSDVIANRFKTLEREPFSIMCHVGGWGPGDRRLLDYQVVYVPFEQCENIYCGNDPRACSEWPVRGVHVCFKSLTFTDLCWRDQGSALYCKQMGESVAAILTTSPTCGYGGLPGVYTLVNFGLELHERVAPADERYKQIPKADLQNKYGVPQAKDLIPAY